MSNRIIEMLQEASGNSQYHPLVSILEISDRTEDDRLAFDCHKTIAKYVESERRSIDIKSQDGYELVNLVVNLSEWQL